MSKIESRDGLPQPQTPSRISKKNRLRHFVGDGVWASVCDGAAESNFHAFASSIVSSSHYISYLASWQNFAGCFLQLWSDRLVKLAGGPKQLVLAGVSVQALILLAMVLMTFSGTGALPFMAAIFFFTAMGGLAGPVWNSWVSTLLPKHRRGYCFGVRNQRTYPAQLLALLAAGSLLQWLPAFSSGLKIAQLAFCAVFLLGLVAKALSLRHLVLQPNVTYSAPPRALGPFELISYCVRDSEIRRAVFFFGAMGFAVTISGPFQTPFLLRNLHMGYLPFAAATAALILGRLLSAAPVGRWLDRIGHERPLILSSFLMPLIPLGWTLSSRFAWILLLQFGAGVVWTIFDLAVFQYLSEEPGPTRRQRLFSIRHISWNLSAALGAVFGGFLISRFQTPELVFWTSTLSRFGASLFVLPALGISTRGLALAFGRPFIRLLARKRAI